MNPDVDQGAAALGALQGSAGVLRARHARARRRHAALDRRQLGQPPPPADGRGAQAERRRRHLLPLRLCTAARSQLQVAQHQPAPEDLGADEPGLPVRRRPHLDRQRRRPQADGASDRVLPAPGVEPRRLAQGQDRRVHPALGRARVRPRACGRDRRHRLQVHQVQRLAQAGAAHAGDLQPVQLPRGRARLGGVARRDRHERRSSTQVLPSEQRDAFYQLVLHPTKASAPGRQR